MVYRCTLAALLCHDTVELEKSADGWIDTLTTSGTIRLNLENLLQITLIGFKLVEENTKVPVLLINLLQQPLEIHATRY